MKKFVLMMLAGVIATTLVAQTPGQSKSRREEKLQKKNERRQRLNELARQEEEGEIVYNKQNVFGLKLDTDGYGLGY